MGLVTAIVFTTHSETSKLHYDGYSDNVERRLTEHNNSQHNTFTSKHRPWKKQFSLLLKILVLQ
ncbi:MAG: GIY-YIG nuclease family protein [Omnitrophica WOR_2 bacterium]